MNGGYGRDNYKGVDCSGGYMCEGIDGLEGGD